MNIIQKLLTINPYSRVGKKNKGIKGIVIHWVENTNSTANENRNFFENRKNEKDGYGSAHFIVDLNGDIIQCIPEDEIAYHVGSKTYTLLAQKKFDSMPNSHTLGIEMTHVDNSGKFSEKTYNETLNLVRYLLNKYGLSKNDIYRHYDITEKICPKYFVDNSAEFEKFKDSI